ncbi:MAG: GNAT family N-acetyltransferase [Segetibacter sp.]
MKDIAIARVEAKDASFLSEVALKAYADHYLHLWHDGGLWYMNKFFAVEQLASEINNQNSRFYIAFFKGTPVGFLKINIHASLNGFEDKNALELERIYLNKQATGKGIGRELVDLTFKIAAENNKNIVWLKAMDTSNGPIAFYKKMGFEIKGTHRLKHPLMKEDLRGMVVMIKELTANTISNFRSGQNNIF